LTWIEPKAEPSFPPLLSGRQVIAGESPGNAALAGVRDGSLGAGDILWGSDPSLVEVAIVLEPDVAFNKAAQMLPLAMVAAGDCIGAIAPPQVGVMFRWPGYVSVNGAPVGTVGVVMDSDTLDANGLHAPSWLIVNLLLRMHLPQPEHEPGQTPGMTALAEEGCEDLSHLDVIGSFARHFLTWLNIWQDGGFRPIHVAWMQRADGRDAGINIPGHPSPVVVTGMDDEGNLLVRTSDHPGPVTALALIDAIELGGASR